MDLLPTILGWLPWLLSPWSNALQLLQRSSADASYRAPVLGSSLDCCQEQKRAWTLSAAQPALRHNEVLTSVLQRAGPAY